MILLRGTLCESVGSAKRRAASGVTEEPSQNRHLFVFEQQWTETTVCFSGQVQKQVYEQYACLTMQTKKICFKLWKSQRPLVNHSSSVPIMQILFLSFRHVKVYNTTNYKVVHNFDYAASILSLALAVRKYIPPFLTLLLLHIFKLFKCRGREGLF